MYVLEALNRTFGEEPIKKSAQMVLLWITSALYQYLTSSGSTSGSISGHLFIL